MTSLPWLAEMQALVGVKEIKGARHSPEVMQLVEDAGVAHLVDDDETAWCATALNGAMKRAGLPYSSDNPARRLLAQSFRKWGTRLAKPVPGAIMVFPRGSQSWQGHVGVVERVNGNGTVTLISGNDGNAVRRSSRYRIRDAFDDGIRWPPGVAAPAGTGSPSRPPQRYLLGERVLRYGDEGEDVEELHRTLNRFGYRLPVRDRFLGDTEAAVESRQKHAGVTVDGVYGPATHTATMHDLDVRERKSAKGKAAGKAAAPGAAAGGIGAGLGSAKVGIDVVRDVGSINDGTIVGVVLVAIVIAAGVGFLIWHISRRSGERDAEPERVGEVDMPRPERRRWRRRVEPVVGGEGEAWRETAAAREAGLDLPMPQREPVPSEPVRAG